MPGSRILQIVRHVRAIAKNSPGARNDDDSAVVCFDWYAGHRTPEIAKLLAESGHVLLMHGGGTTAYEQVNDTHLHAQLEHMMKASRLRDLAGADAVSRCRFRCGAHSPFKGRGCGGDDHGDQG